MHRKGRYIFLPVVAVFIIAAALNFNATGAKPSHWDVEAAARKADYTFMRAVGALNSDNEDGGMRLMARALSLNPSDREIKAQAAETRLVYGGLTEDDLDEVYQCLLERFRENPSDYTGANMTAQLAEHMGRLDDLIEIYSSLDSHFPSRTTPAGNLANAYVKRYMATHDTTDFDKAMAIFNRLERGTGKDIGLSSQKIRAYALRNDTAAIVGELTDLTAAMPGNSRAYLLAGSIYNSLGMDSMALPNLRKACEVDSANGEALYTLAQYYNAVGDSAAYDAQVFRALKTPDLDVDAKYEILRVYVAKFYSDSTQWKRLEELFSVLGDVNPGEPKMHELYGGFEVARKDLPAAAEQFSYALALEPSNDRTRSLLMQLYHDIDSLDKSLEVAREGMRISPDNLGFPLFASAILQREKRYEEGLELLRSVKIGEVRNKEAVSNFVASTGDMYYLLDMPDSAYACYDRAIALYPDNYMAYNNYAYFLAEKDKDLDRALDMSRLAVLNDPDNPTVLDTYAWVYFKRRDYAEAKKQIDRALALYRQTSADDSVAVGEFMPDEPVSEDSVTNVPPVAPDSVTAVTRQPGTDDSNGADDDDDEVVVEEVVEADESVTPPADILSHAGDIYFMCGKPDEALEFWKQALEQEPDNELLVRKVKNRTYFYK
ncbi:MAG: tetratricopeptide repeat protein [Bacteroidales bacterium]|nr:tetratricopeptide repeat protein [Bacteroidales bacterium]